MSFIPLQIYLTPLTFDATAASGQMALLHYVAQQSIAVWEKQSWLKPTLGSGQGKIDPTLESDNGLTSSKVQHPIPQGKMGLMPSKKDQLEAERSHSTLMSTLSQDPTYTSKVDHPSTATTTTNASGEEAQYSESQEDTTGWHGWFSC